MSTSGSERPKQDWEPMTVTYLGTVSELVQGGGGKSSSNSADKGDNGKPKGQG